MKLFSHYLQKSVFSYNAEKNRAAKQVPKEPRNANSDVLALRRVYKSFGALRKHSFGKRRAVAFHDIFRKIFRSLRKLRFAELYAFELAFKLFRRL